MLVSIALTAATVGLCTTRACKKHLDETQCPRSETRPTGPRPRHIAPRSRRDPRRIGPRPRRDRDETLVLTVETVSRPRRLDRDHIPD